MTLLRVSLRLEPSLFIEVSEVLMKTFDNLILNGRPNGGKTDFTHFIRASDFEDRRQRLHIGNFIELDDFEWLWEKFIEDDMWESIGRTRRFSKAIEGGYIQTDGNDLHDFLIARFNMEMAKHLSEPGIHDEYTFFLEFSRGLADGGYQHAYELLSDQVLERAAIVYIQVSYEESRRRNAERPHPLPEASLVRFSAETDWESLTQGEPAGYIELRGFHVPFVTMNNETRLSDPQAQRARYSSALQQLMRLYENR